MKLTIIIPTKDRGAIFINTLKSAVSATAHLDVEIVVVNDSKNSVPRIPIDASHVQIFKNPKSGAASARNFGVKKSIGNILLFLDDDIIISKESVDHVLALHDQYPKACFNFNWTYPPELKQKLAYSSFGRFLKTLGMDHLKGWYNDPTWKDEALFPVKSLASFHLSISRTDFEKAGGYNENFPFAGFEDYDFPIRIRKANLACYIDSRITVFHNESDRVEVKNWLNNWMRRGATRKVAVNLGYSELALHYGLLKRVALQLLSFTLPVLFFVLSIIPNTQWFDRIYLRLIAMLQAVKIYEGYRSVKE